MFQRRRIIWNSVSPRTDDVLLRPHYLYSPKNLGLILHLTNFSLIILIDKSLVYAIFSRQLHKFPTVPMFACGWLKTRTKFPNWFQAQWMHLKALWVLYQISLITGTGTEMPWKSWYWYVTKMNWNIHLNMPDIQAYCMHRIEWNISGKT